MFRKLALIALSATALSLPVAAVAGPKGCPPGLASKGCVPPGQAKKMRSHDHDRDRDHREVRREYYRAGDRITGDYVVIRDPSRYGLRPDYTYYRSDDRVYRVDPETRKVLDVIGAIAALAN